MRAMTERRRALIAAAAKQRLPWEYQEVEYLQNDGTAVVDTGYVPKPTSTHQMLLTFAFTNLSGTQIVFSAQEPFSDNGIFQLPLGPIGSTPKLCCQFSTSWVMSERTAYGAPSLNTKYTFSMSGLQSSCLGTTFSVNPSASNTTESLCLFGKHSENNTRAKARIYYCSYTISGSKKMELIPCYRISDNKPGFYDTVRKTFLTASSGSLTTGPAV